MDLLPTQDARRKTQDAGRERKFTLMFQKTEPFICINPLCFSLRHLLAFWCCFLFASNQQV